MIYNTIPILYNHNYNYSYIYKHEYDYKHTYTCRKEGRVDGRVREEVRGRAGISRMDRSSAYFPRDRVRATGPAGRSRLRTTIGAGPSERGFDQTPAHGPKQNDTTIQTLNN